MRLRALEIQGFKSFPDKTSLEFTSGITAVVGPNGSGKSNIADAMRWVLGEQSSKTLRGGRMEDVIFGGTQTRKSVGYASVRLTIDNADGALPVEGETVSVTRRLHRSGESEYRINEVMVRLRDVHELFMDTGLGRDGYSVIGQGRIAEIVSSKSQQRREIFEETAGITKYRYRKEEAQRKLASTEENLVRLRDILSELESRVGPLAEQAEKARAFLEYSAEKQALEVSLWVHSLQRLREQITAQEGKVYAQKNEYEQLERESARMEEQLAEIFEQSQSINVQTEERREGIKEREDRIAQRESRIAVLHNDILHNTQSLERLEREAETAGRGTREVREELEEKRRRMEAGAESLGALTRELTALEEALGTGQAELEAAGTEARQMEVRAQSVAMAIGEAKLSKTAGETLIRESLERMGALRQSSTAHDDAVEELKEAIEECRERCAREAQTIAELENSRQGYQMKRENRERKLRELAAREAELESRMAAKLQRAGLLEDMESAMEGFAGSVKFVLAEARQGALRGVCGPVSSLIGVESRYALAIETALGAGMQNIVVEDEETAKAAIRSLKSARAGRATFLPLTSVKGRKPLRGSELSGYDGFVGVGSELVECDARYAGIVGQLLGRVAVAESLDDGAQIARASGYAFRVVTLDGQVINAGGSFTGGSSSKSAGILGRRGEIKRLKAEAGDFKRDRDALAPERAALEEEISSLEAYLRGAASELQTAQEERMRLELSLEQLEKNLGQARENRRLARAELENLTGRVEELQGSDITAAELMEELEAQLTALQEEGAQAAGLLRELEAGIQSSSQELGQRRLAHLEAKKDHEGMEQEIRRLEEQLLGMGGQAQENLREQEELKAATARIEGEIGETRFQIEEERRSADALAAEIAGLLERRTALEAKSTGLRAQERELSGRRETVSREMARLEERRVSLQLENDNIIAKMWDEYELTRSKAMELAQPLPDAGKARARLDELRGQIRRLGSVNVAAVEEYEEVSGRYGFLRTQVGDVEEAKSGLLRLIDELTGEMREMFRGTFEEVARHFSKIFVQLFGGGKAELVLTGEEDVLESGVEILVQPPGKLIKSLSLLSGGEQAFVAIAIYFAILKVRPAPFCLLDEIEAALDDVNVVKFASYLRQMTGRTQFIAITHRRGTMEEADVLYGVTMQEEGVSKLLKLNVGEVEEKLGMQSE